MFQWPSVDASPFTEPLEPSMGRKSSAELSCLPPILYEIENLIQALCTWSSLN